MSVAILLPGFSGVMHRLQVGQVIGLLILPVGGIFIAQRYSMNSDVVIRRLAWTATIACGMVINGLLMFR